MESLIIKAKRYCPHIRLLPDEKIFAIEGFSMPENVADLYVPVLQWFDVFYEEAEKKGALKNGPYIMIFRLSYFNSASLRYIVDIIKKVDRLHQGGININIQWYYDEGDTQIKESGTELADLVTLPFEVIKSE